MSEKFWEKHPIAGQQQTQQPTIAGTVSQQEASQQGQIPKIVPQDDGVDQQDPLFTFKSDPLESIGPAEMLTRGKVNAATAQNSIIRAALAKAKPTGKLVPNAGGGATWVPDPVETPPVVGNVGQFSPTEAKQISDIERRNAGADAAAATQDLANQKWRENEVARLATELGQGNGKVADNLHQDFTSLLGMEMERVRSELVKEGYPQTLARTIAYDSVVKAFKTNFRINPQFFNWADQQVAPIDDRIVHFGGDAGGDPMTPEAIAAQKKEDRDPEDRNRGWWSALWNGGAAELTPKDVINHSGFKNVLNESVGKLPNPFTKKKEYEQAGDVWANENAGTDAVGIANFIGSTEEKVRQKLSELMFLEDIRRNGVARGYAKKTTDGQIIRSNITQEEIDSVIVPQIESLKKALTNVR